MPNFEALGYKSSIKLAESYGLETPKQACFSTDDEFSKIISSAALAYPVVLKAIPIDAGHKAEKQLVVVNLKNETEAREAFWKMRERVGAMALECFVLQEQASGAEFIVGGKKDPVFGQTLVFGLGGTLVELIEDAAVRVCPIDEAEAAKMVLETKAGKFFSQEGFRGTKVSLEAAAKFLANASRMLSDNQQIAEMDLNPVIASQEKFCAVDLRIMQEKE